jgi:phospholipid/cholesterol/gamma-HCH transport system substrate-binding protein
VSIRQRFDIFPAKHRSRPVAIGFVVIAVSVIALISGIRHHIPLIPKAGHVVAAEFRAADQVSNRTVVRVNGIAVGRVEGIEPGSDPYRTSRVLMRVSDGTQLHADASAQIRWRTLFGGLMYIDLQPGSAAAPLGGPISAGRTSNQVEIDQLLETYAGRVAQQQRNLFKGLRGTFADPSGIGQTLQVLGPALKTVDQGLQPLLGVQSDDLQGLVAATARTVQGLNDTAGLQGLVSGADQTLAVTDSQRQNLGQLLDLSPPALQSTFTTMNRLRTTLGHLDPLVSQLRPGARALAPAARAATPALAETETVLGDLQPLLRAAGPTFDALRLASPLGVTLMHGLDPTIARTLTNILPWLNTRDSGTRLKNYEAIGPFWSDLSMAAGEYDSIGYRIRFTVPLGANSLLGAPIAGHMAQACAVSALQHASTQCPNAIRLLTQGWFGSQTKGHR